MIFASSPPGRRVRARVAVFLLAGVAGIVASLPGAAYQQYGVQVGNRTIPLKWNQMPVHYYIGNVAVSGVSVSQLQAAVAASFATWQAVPTVSLSSQFSGLTNARADALGDGLSVLGFVADPSEPDVLGSTSWMIDEVTGEIVESDIFFNSTIPWSVAASGDPRAFDLQSIATHEIGHLWGLGHSALGETEQVSGGRRVIAKASVMFPIAFAPPNIKDRSLQPDDIAGISDLYPGGGFNTETGSVTGTVTKNGHGVFGAHVVAFSPTAGTMVGNFTQDNNGSFTISGLTPGPVILRVEPVDDADLESFFDDPSAVDVNFKVTYYSLFAIVSGGGNTASIRIQVTPK